MKPKLLFQEKFMIDQVIILKITPKLKLSFWKNLEIKSYKFITVVIKTSISKKGFRKKSLSLPNH